MAKINPDELPEIDEHGRVIDSEKFTSFRRPRGRVIVNQPYKPGPEVDVNQTPQLAKVPTPEEQALMRRAIRERWVVDPVRRNQLLEEMQAICIDRRVSPNNRVRAFKAIMGADALNLKAAELALEAKRLGDGKNQRQVSTEDINTRLTDAELDTLIANGLLAGDVGDRRRGSTGPGLSGPAGRPNVEDAEIVPDPPA